MRKRRSYIAFGMVTLLILGLSYFLWWRPKTSNGKENLTGDKASMVNSTANKAKTKMAKLTIQSASMAITGISGDKIRVRNTVVLKNPLPIELNLTGLDYAVSINSVKAAEGRYSQPISIPGSGSKTITLPMVVSAKAIDQVNDKLEKEGKDSAVYTFFNTVHTNIPIAGERKFEVNMKEVLPMVWLPQMKPGDLDIKKFSLKNAGMKMTLQVTNPNSFDLTMQDGNYSMAIDGKHTLHGSMQEVVKLPAKATVPVDMHLDMKTGKALKMGWKMLVDKKDTRYKLVFDSKLVSNEKMLKNCSVHFTDEGTLDQLVKALKNH